MGKAGKKGAKSKKGGAPTGVVGRDDNILPDNSRPGCVEDHYIVKKEIGRGGMSVVHEGVCKTTGARWALKFIDKNVVEDINVLTREIDIMKKLQHPNILALREVFWTDTQIQLVTELVTGGELFEKIVEVGSYSEADAASIIRQVLEGVAYLHSNNVAHRDLKPENLLVGGDDEDLIKIADFGLSKSFEGSDAQGQKNALVTSCGTPDYVAPEVLRGEEYDKSVDLWSTGVITYILLCGFPPFWGENQGELFDKILSVNYDFPDPEWTNISAEAKDFIKNLLVKDEKQRLSAKSALAHAWIQSYAPKAAPEKGRGALRSLDSVAKLTDYHAKRKAAQAEFDRQKAK